MENSELCSRSTVIGNQWWDTEIGVILPFSYSIQLKTIQLHSGPIADDLAHLDSTPYWTLLKSSNARDFFHFFFFNVLSFKGYHLVCYDKLHINWALTCLSSRRTCLVSSILFLLTCLMATRFPWEEAEQWLQCEGQHWCRVHFKHSCLQHGDINTGALCSRCK